MTKDEVAKYLIKPICTSTIESEEYCKQLEAYTTAVESLNGRDERRMKEYIVHPPKDNLLVVEEYSTFYGEPVKELIRCKDCKHMINCYRAVLMYGKDGSVEPRRLDSFENRFGMGFCSLAERKEE